MHNQSEKAPEASHDEFQVAGSELVGVLDEVVDVLDEVVVVVDKVVLVLIEVLVEVLVELLVLVVVVFEQERLTFPPELDPQSKSNASRPLNTTGGSCGSRG